VTDPSSDGKFEASRLRLVSDPTSTTPPVPDFSALFMAHYAYVCRSLSYFGVPSHATEDVTQEVFLVLHRRLAELDPTRDVRSWLWGIARRVAHTHVRAATRAQRKHDDAPAPAAPPIPDAQLERRERAEIVERFVAKLSDKLRDVFVLSEIEGLAAPAIAEALDLELNTVYSRVRLARERFARTLRSLHAEQVRASGGRSDA
jgi:RNA polymerase sigma-70 factor (ECF subfamily)